MTKIKMTKIRLENLSIRILNLFRISIFGLRISERGLILLGLFFVVVSVVSPLSVSAQLLTTPIVPCGLQPGPNTPAGFDRPCTVCDLGFLVINLTNFFIWNIAIPFAGLMFIIGGVMIMFGAASEARVTSGKKMLTNTLIGVIIVFVSWIAVDTIIKVLTGNTDFAGSQGQFFGTLGPWNEVPRACNL